MAARKHLAYDDDAVCGDIAAGEMTYAQIGEKHGMSEAMVGAISRGEKRLGLKARIDARVAGQLAEARRLGTSAARKAFKKLVNLLDAQDEDVQRRAACDILKWTLGDPGKTVVTVTQNAAPGPIAHLKDGPVDLNETGGNEHGHGTENENTAD